MESLFCTIDAKKIVVTGALGERASGGACVTRYTVLPRRTQMAAAPAGKVLSLDAYRRKTERETAAAAEEPAECPDRSGRLSFGLELLSSAAVLCMALVIAVKFILL